MHKTTSLLGLLLLIATLPACLGDGCSSCKKQETPVQDIAVEEVDVISMPDGAGIDADTDAAKNAIAFVEEGEDKI